jgi:hypothetical protein
LVLEPNPRQARDIDSFPGTVEGITGRIAAARHGHACNARQSRRLENSRRMKLYMAQWISYNYFFPAGGFLPVHRGGDRIRRAKAL